MWIEGNLCSGDDWLFGINRYNGFDPDLDLDCELCYFTIGLGLFSVSLVFKK